MVKTSILWADDEIELLRPHILFLEKKGYEVVTTNNGSEAIDLVRERHFDIVFLDEQMPGISGVETLERIKVEYPNLPIVMITKSEEESIMEDAIGSNIADYLIKPVNPNQILLSLKRNLEKKQLVDEKSTSKYQQEFRKIGMDINNTSNISRNGRSIAIVCSKLFSNVENNRSARLSTFSILTIGCATCDNVNSVIFKDEILLIENILKLNIDSIVNFNGLQ